MRFQYTLVNHWPPLAWLARCNASSGVIEVEHGHRVETRSQWFCEAVWDDSFEAGAFDRTDLVFGSGGRIREDGVTFVSAGSTVDRLHSWRDEEETVWVSNSLVCLLAATGGEVDPTYPHYLDFFQSIGNGIGAYRRKLPTFAGSVRLTYFRNLFWDGNDLSEVEKPVPQRDFNTFSKYYTFLSSSLHRLAQNMASAERTYRYKMLGTLSSGYDSPTVSTLAVRHGLEEAISFKSARGGAPDSGHEIADILGVKLTLVERSAWRKEEHPEVLFIAAEAAGGDVFFKGAEDKLAGRVLLTGFHGGGVWNKKLKNSPSEFPRGDCSGLALSEYRLHTGFIHVPVPYFGATQQEDINAISNSDEMSPWDVGDWYSRPICRRIVEEAGVPRELFGVSKKAGSVLFHKQHSFLTPTSRDDYLRWLSKRAQAWLRKGRVPPHLLCKAVGPLQAGLRLNARALHFGAETLREFSFVERSWFFKRATGKLQRIAKYYLQQGRREYLFNFLFPWAMERAKRHYMPIKG